MGAVSMRRVLATVLISGLIAGSVVVAASAPATAACRVQPASVASQIMDASDVFSGSVSKRQRTGGRLVYTVGVERVYKGSVDTSEVDVSTDAAPRGCGLTDLQTGRRYVFLADSGGSGLTTDKRSGTARATGRFVAQVERVLGAGRPPTPPAPIEATFTMVSGAPTSLARLVAPGLALVIIGLLGLGLVVGLGRRTSG
jgi:hypothetical protein